MLITCSVLQARPLSIIIVTSTDSSEEGYRDFLRDIYLDNAAVAIDDDRYQEPLNDVEKQELLSADLIIVSSDNSGGDYNADSAFWASLPVPILSHSISVCRSNGHDNWDWFGSGQQTISLMTCVPVVLNDRIFNGIDFSGPILPLFDSALDVSLPDAAYSGYGTLLATDSAGLPMLVRFSGNEPAYYDSSLYAPNGSPRIYFAMPSEPALFFENATPAARQLLRNAVTGLLPQCWLTGDIDCDRDVDLHDLSEMAAQWLLAALSDPPAADIVPDGTVNVDDLMLLAGNWLEGFDITPPLPNPSEWTDAPAVQDGGFIQMKAAAATDDQHGVQYRFDCLEDSLYSSGWQYDRTYTASTLPVGVTLSFRTKARDTSSRFNETVASAAQTVRTDGLFYCIADASAAVPLDNERFIAAGDEENALRVYNWNQPASNPITLTDVSAAIAVDSAHPEADIEGATWYNNRIFWITSHGRSRDGDYWESRYRLFATSVSGSGTVTVDGCYAGLIDCLIQYDRVWNLGLQNAIGVLGDHINPATIANLAPKVDGLNIEGLCTTADGTKLYIAFRNPRPLVNGKIMALVIPLANPEAVVLSGQAPILEPPLLIDLNDRGIRSIEYSMGLGEYLIVAGSHRGTESDPLLDLYKYDFALQDRDRLASFSDMTPEAIFQFPADSGIHLLSDDGTRMIITPEGPVMNKLLPIAQRTYRTRTIRP